MLTIYFLQLTWKISKLSFIQYCPVITYPALTEIGSAGYSHWQTTASFIKQEDTHRRHPKLCNNNWTMCRNGAKTLDILSTQARGRHCGALLTTKQRIDTIFKWTKVKSNALSILYYYLCSCWRTKGCSAKLERKITDDGWTEGSTANHCRQFCAMR